MEIKAATPSKALFLLRLLLSRLVKMLDDGFNGFGGEKALGVDAQVRVVRRQIVGIAADPVKGGRSHSIHHIVVSLAANIPMHSWDLSQLPPWVEG